MLVLACITLLLYVVIPVILIQGIRRGHRPPYTLYVDRGIFVSIVVAVYNEESHVGPLLQSLLDQNYPPDRYEIILVDDHSTDQTLHRAQLFVDRFPEKLIILHAPVAGWQSRKKTALAAGIRAARGEWILLTDADARPPKTWIRAITAAIRPGTDLVAGFSPQCTLIPGPWADYLWTDSLASAFVAAGTIGWGWGVTCAGRNLAYRRQAFARNEGFLHTPDTLSGDDDFILQQLARHGKGNLAYAYTPESHVPAEGPPTPLAFLRQKQRHLSAGSQYSLAAQLGYAVFHTSNFLLIGLTFVALWHRPVLAAVWPLKALLDYVVLQSFCRHLGVKLKPVGWLLWQVGYPLSHLLAGPVAFAGKPHWKSRKPNAPS